MFPKFPTVVFSDPEIPNGYPAEFREYVDLRVRGFDSLQAFEAAFGFTNCENMETKIRRLEATPHYRAAFEARIKAIPVDELINDKIAIVELMTTYRNPRLRDSARIAAFKEALVLAGITTVDADGRTLKAGSDLDDLYADRDAAILAERTAKGTVNVH